MDSHSKESDRMDDAQQRWGEVPADHYGYNDDQQRREKRGLEDWEMVENISPATKYVPKWVYAGVFGIVLMAFALSLPFWGDRPGYDRAWITAGHLYALLYFLLAAGVIYIMTNLYSSGRARGASFEDEAIEMPHYTTSGDS